MFDDVDGPHEVDGDQRLPVLVREMADRAPRRDAGDVHHDVHRRRRSADDGVDVRGERGHLLVVGDVERSVRGHPGPERTYVGNGLLQTLGVAIGEEQLSATSS